jgi:hypothetical protein
MMRCTVLTTEEETAEIVKYLKAQAQPIYNQTILQDTSENAEQMEMDQEVDEI